MNGMKIFRSKMIVEIMSFRSIISHLYTVLFHPFFYRWRFYHMVTFDVRKCQNSKQHLEKSKFTRNPSCVIIGLQICFCMTSFLSMIFRIQKKCFWSEFCDINTRCTKILFFFIKRCKSILINDYIKSWFVLFKYDWINITFNRIRTSDNIAFLVIGAWITLLPVTWA